VEEKSNGLPLSFYVVAVSSFLFALTRNVTQPIFTLYVLDLGADLLQVGLVVSMQSFLMIVSRIPLTMVAERIGYRRMFLIAFLVQTTSPIMYAFIPGPIWLYVIPFYEIIASGSFNQLAMTTASNMAPPYRQGDAIGRYMTFMTMGMFVGPLITSALLNYFNYSQLYLAASLFPFIGFLLFLRYIPKEGVFERAEVEAGEEEEIGVLDSLKVILRDRNVLILTLIRATYSMANTMFTTLFVLYAVSIGFTESQAALLFSMVGFANAFSKLPAGRIADRLGSKKVLHVLLEGSGRHHDLPDPLRGLLGDEGGDGVGASGRDCSSEDQGDGNVLPLQHMGRRVDARGLPGRRARGLAALLHDIHTARTDQRARRPRDLLHKGESKRE